LSLADQQNRAVAISDQARSGLAGVAALQRAHDNLRAFNFPLAQQEARMAGAALAPLGDAGRVAEANQILTDLWRWQWGAGIAVLGAGVLSVLGGAVAVIRSRRRAAHVPVPVFREESTSWL
jgi:hypothetical protein